MAFEQKTWEDRITEYPTRRTLTKTDGSSEMVTVERSEGSVSKEGDAFSAANMNDLENRIAETFGSCSFDVQKDGAYVTYTPPGGADAVTKKLGSNDLQISAYLQTYANGGSHSDESGINISVTDYSKITLNSVTPMASGYPKSYSIKINNTVVSAGAEIDLTSVDDLAIVLSIDSLEAQYKSYGFKITFTLSV